MAFDVREGRDTLWAKTNKPIQYIYVDAEWFMKADDDMFANLRIFLASYSNCQPVNFGCKIMCKVLI